MNYYLIFFSQYQERRKRQRKKEFSTIFLVILALILLICSLFFSYPPLHCIFSMNHYLLSDGLISILLVLGFQVDKKYNHYCEQMQMVVNSFDSVMGFGAAAPYTALARKAMSRHFRCLKDTIVAQLKHTCELLGEKDGVGTSGITKGETPRLRILEQSLRQQRAFNQMGMMEQEAWRPQRGLPERSVNILRAWLFEHFLHPYVLNSLYQCLTLVRTNKKIII